MPLKSKKSNRISSSVTKTAMGSLNAQAFPVTPSTLKFLSPRIAGGGDPGLINKSKS
jgi:hypothetical protein